MDMNFEALSRARRMKRAVFAMDAVQASQSGHLGLPLGCAEMGAVLYGYVLKHNPDKAALDRARLFRSLGRARQHVPLRLAAHERLRFADGGDQTFPAIAFSKTPGHPEFFETPGVECTTGPLGQGVGNAVGIAMAAKMAAARFNTAEHRIFDQHCHLSGGRRLFAGRRFARKRARSPAISVSII